MKVIRVSNDDDWVGYYIDGLMTDQNHSVSADEILETLSGMGVLEYESYIADADWMYSQGYLPEEFSEIPEGILE